jgi:uncharacterized protein YkwD
VLPDTAGVTKRTRNGSGVFRRVAVVAVSILVAVAVGFLVGDPQTVAAAGYKAKRCGGGKVVLSGREKKAFVIHNRIRRRHHLPTFCVHPALEQAARRHSKDMIARDYLSHRTIGRDEGFAARIRRFGYDGYRTIGENIALGGNRAGTPVRIMHAWMNSEGHKRNILNGKFRQIGIGASTGNYKGRESVSIYTADFGAKRR